MRDFYEYTISQRFLPALINDDWQGLEEEDASALRRFMQRERDTLPAGATGAQWQPLVADCRNVARCDITGLLSHVADVGLVFNTAD